MCEGELCVVAREETPILAMIGITKVYPNGLVANSKVDFQVQRGEIHALVGENGAGKTTLMKVLFGLEKADEGDIFIRGQKVKISSPHDAIRHGVGMVHQHFMLAPSLTVAENIVLGAEPRRGLWFDRKKAEEISRSLSEEYGLHVDVRAPIKDVPVGVKQKVEILKALLRGSDILVLDEPTAVLTPQETGELFLALKALKEKGHTIIFISHKLREVKELSDRVTVMRGGRVVGTRKTAEISSEEISRMMVGRDVELRISRPTAASGKAKKVVLLAKNLQKYSRDGKEVLKKVSLQVRSGEILGIAGVEGNGQVELVEALCGLSPADGGQVFIAGKDATGKSPGDIRNMGVSHIPQDRMTYGVAAEASIEENLISTRYRISPVSRGISLDLKAICQISRHLIERFTIKATSPSQSVSTLSGGNIQKVVVAREFSTNPQVIIADQPTRGIDVGATEAIHRYLVEATEKGAAVLLVSADLAEVMGLSNRLCVMYEGEIVAFFPEASEVTEEELGLYMLGLKRQDPREIEAAMMGEAESRPASEAETGEG
ncbi:MAG TPA: ABC transporter ATP-binding protein [Firmicutes bacterium]|nr:ABC transporter ATP-binding protein [Candidatus Fermentithermobacillaceae bacterium]